MFKLVKFLTIFICLSTYNFGISQSWGNLSEIETYCINDDSAIVYSSQLSPSQVSEIKIAIIEQLHKLSNLYQAPLDCATTDYSYVFDVFLVHITIGDENIGTAIAHEGKIYEPYQKIHFSNGLKLNTRGSNYVDDFDNMKQEIVNLAEEIFEDVLSKLRDSN